MAWLLFWHYWAHRIVGITLVEALKDILPFALTALAAMAVAYFVTLSIGNIYLRLTAKVLSAVIIYIGIMQLTHAVVMKESLEYILKKRK